jgi:hypothetical protein
MPVSETSQSCLKAQSTLSVTLDVTQRSWWPDLSVFISLWSLAILPQHAVQRLFIPISSESAGLLFVSEAFTAFDEDTYAAAFGGIGVTMVDST